VRLLALSTSSPALSLALFDGDRLVAHDHRVIGRGHAEALVPALAALLGGLSADAIPVDAILVDVGPGSFTGIRIGIAAARALGLAWGVPVAGVSASALVAAAAFAGDPGLACVTVLLDAGRGQAFAQRVARNFGADSARPIDAAAAAAHDPASSAGALAPAGAACRGDPDMRLAAALPATARQLPPDAIYVRPADAVLPL
jgi:tRNA threonylcarbamoyladenosine biosynthesis protein TsaB